MSSVQSIRRAFDVLGALAGGPLGVTEVADRAGLPKSTAARLLATLAREGAVEQVPGDTRYRLGPRLVTLAARIRTGPLAGGAGATVADRAGRSRPARRPGLRVPDGDLVHYIDQVDTPNPVSVRDWTGSRVPLHAVSSGQVLLAFRPPAVVERYLGRPLERFTPRTLVDRRRAARADARDPPRRLRLGSRGVRRGHHVGRGADRRCVGRGRRRGPPPRAVVPVPGARSSRRAGRASWSRRRADLREPAPGGVGRDDAAASTWRGLRPFG